MWHPFREFRRRLAEIETRLATHEAALSDAALRERMKALTGIVDFEGRPNINALWEVARDLPAAHLSLKFFGYELAERLRIALPIRTNLQPTHVGLKSKACTQSDMESDWAAYWSSQYQVPLVFHRKLWEFCYCSQALFEHNKLRSSLRGLGFGCGSEPLPSYFAYRGIDVVATDAPLENSNSRNWAETKQHLSHIDQVFKPDIVDRATFDARVTHRFVDMNAIPDDLRDFDFCWSICALEHLGSIARGLNFIENSLETLRPGGVAVHTTEFSFFDDEKTVDNWGTVFFQKKHFIEIADRLRAVGHSVEPFDFDVGRRPMDRFIDVAPFEHHWGEVARGSWAGDQRHLKLEWDGFIVTCFGIIVTKAK
jgi:SAM-dependent methyltransferase